MKVTGNIPGTYWYVLAALVCIALLVPPAPALRDPSAVYCTAMGCTFSIGHSPAGEVGYCTLPDGKTVDAWRFLQGMEGSDQGYCAKHGYPVKVVSSPATCIRFLTGSCAVCVLPDGSEVEVTRLMNLSFAETVCGDRICGFPENQVTCPADCPSGATDEYCDGILDGRCDRDCRGHFGRDADCPVAGIPLVFLAAGALAVVAVAVLLYLRRSKKRG